MSNKKLSLDWKKLATKENIFLGLILLASAAILAVRMGEPFGGFHGFNEAFYVIYAKKFLGHPISYLLTGATDFNNPPLFSYLLYISFKIFGVSEASARLVPIVSTVLSVLFVYKIGNLIYDKTVGLIAALLFALSPAVALVGRNVQLEPTSILFTLIALYYYLKSKTADEIKNKCLAGLFLGLGIFTKWPAGLLLPVIVIWEIIINKNLRWINRSFAYFILITLAVPLPWLGYHLVFSREALVAQQQVRSGTAIIPSLDFLKNGLFVETFWMFSPLVFLLLIGGLVSLLIRRKKADIIIGLNFIAYIIFYLFYNQHSYYLMPIVPFGILAIAALSSWRKDKTIVWVIVAIISITSFFFAELMLFGNKYGYAAFKEAGDAVKKEKGGQKVTVQVTPNMHGSYEPVITHYFPENSKVTVDEQKGTKNVYFLVGYNSPSVETDKEKGIYVTSHYRIRPVLFGYEIFQSPPNSHLFANGSINFQKTEKATYFGVVRIPVNSLILVNKEKYISSSTQKKKED